MVEYKAFKVGELFEVKMTKKLTELGPGYIKDSEIISPEGVTPYIAAVSTNNGISGYSLFEATNDGGVITVSTTADSANTLFYQEDPFIGRQQMAQIKHADGSKLTRREAQYLISLLRKLIGGFNYGVKLRVDNLVEMEIELPITAEDTPDFDFMENYIKEIEQKHISKLEAELEARTEAMLRLIGREDLIGDMEALGVLVEQGFEEEVEYGEFMVGELFEVKRGKRLKGADREPGEVVYCSATQTNNGVTDYIDNPLFLESNKITVSTFLDVFYQEGTFTASDEITMLGAEWLNRRSGQFIAASIKKSREGKYGYGYKAFSKEVSGFEIELPATADGTPDLEYMERYIAYIELKHTHTAYVAECKRIDLMRQLVI